MKNFTSITGRKQRQPFLQVSKLKAVKEKAVCSNPHTIGLEHYFPLSYIALAGHQVFLNSSQSILSSPSNKHLNNTGD